MSGDQQPAPSSRPQRRVRRFIILVAWGLAATVTVSWALAVIHPVNTATPPLAYGLRYVGDQYPSSWVRPLRIHVLTWRCHGAQFYCSAVAEYPAGGSLGPLPTPVTPEEAVPAWAARHVIPGKGGAVDERPGPHFHSHYIAAYGWPLPALWCRINARNQGKDGSLEMVAAGGVMLSAGTPSIKPPQQPPPTLPLRPHWPALAINLALTTAACWLIKLAFISLRARLYIPPGHCRQCRYDLRGLAAPVCPECGGEASPSSAPLLDANAT